MTYKRRLEAFALLGDFLNSPDPGLEELILQGPQQNSWFTVENIRKAIAGIGQMLIRADLEIWFNSASADFEKKNQNLKAVGLILAGNIPLVGFHDVLCVLASGNKALIKLSSSDQKLTPYILTKLTEIEPTFLERFQFVERLIHYDAVIATGSGNSSRYFEYYFKNVPHIIRKNRNSIAVLNGNESKASLTDLGHDIFDYFGLGCRNVSKVYVPVGYDFKFFFEAIEEFKAVADHHKYFNNYEYNKSIFLVNMQKHLDNGFLLLKQDERIASPLAVLYFEEYVSLLQLSQVLKSLDQQVQCVVTNMPVVSQSIDFGQTQQPKLWDYADKINTLNFLNTLN
ncbi:MAG: acyl-CoA reductase [Flavobacterium sp.]|nr:acyl-CoA reductase [Pedobacter sp.]